VSRLKLMAKLNIAERRLPQDGRIKISYFGTRRGFTRFHAADPLWGERCDAPAGPFGRDFYDLRRLGFDDHMLERMEHYTSLPHGLFLVTGPTGSANHTLYSALKAHQSAGQKDHHD